MADRFYLSLWLKEYGEAQMLERFRTLLEAFPYSELRPGVQALRVHPLNWTEPLVVDHTFGEGAEISEALALAADFTHGDYAYEASVFWDLWVFRSNGGPAAWKRAARPVTLVCYGPDFEDGQAERGHLEVDFGLDTPFRAERDIPDAQARILTSDYRQRLQENIRKLLDLVRQLEERLPVGKRLLWIETGENFAEMIQKSLQ